MRVKFEKIEQQKLWLKDKIESQKTLTEWQRKKKNNKHQNEKKNIWEIVIEGLNWKENTKLL